jgi:hypothetical protein
MADIMVKHSSFKGFTTAYNYLRAPKRQERFFLYSKRITEVFYTYHMNKYMQDFLGQTLISDYLQKLTIFSFLNIFYFS